LRFFFGLIGLSSLMIRKFLALLLVTALTFSALVVPYGQTTAADHTTMTTMHGHTMHDAMPKSHPVGHHHNAEHICIGCIAVYGRLAIINSAAPVTDVLPPSWFPHALPSMSKEPTTPPPQNA
jgi:hypothetical protein